MCWLENPVRDTFNVPYDLFPPLLIKLLITFGCYGHQGDIPQVLSAAWAQKLGHVPFSLSLCFPPSDLQSVELNTQLHTHPALQDITSAVSPSITVSKSALCYKKSRTQMVTFLASYFFFHPTIPLSGTPTLVALWGVLLPFQLSRNEDQAWVAPFFHEVLLCQWAHQLGCLKFYHRHGSEWAPPHKASPARLAPVAFSSGKPEVTGRWVPARGNLFNFQQQCLGPCQPQADRSSGARTPLFPPLFFLLCPILNEFSPVCFKNLNLGHSNAGTSMCLTLNKGFKSHWSCPACWFQRSRKEREVEKKVYLPPLTYRPSAPSIRPKNWSLGGRESWNQFGFLIPHEALIPALTFSNEFKCL